MINKYLIIAILAIGIILSENYIIASVVPALILNGCLWIIVAYAKQTYPTIIWKQLAYKDVQRFIKRWYIVILIVVSKLSIAASVIYFFYLLFTKFYGVIQL